MLNKKKIELYRPFLKGNEKRYLLDAINTNELTFGKYLKKFSQIITKITGSKYTIPIQNGTSALFLSLHVLNVKRFDEVLVPSITFIASVNSIRYCGANPVFMDVDKSGNLDISKTLEFIKFKTIYKNGYTFNKATKKKIVAIILVHTFGNVVNLTNEFLKVCKKRNIKILEDAAESLGSYYILKGKKKHSGTIGDIGCISFNGNKIVTSSGGGIILTNNKKYSIKLNYLINQAKSKNIEFIHNEVGYNFRLSNLHAAVVVGQLENLNKILIYKNKINLMYKKLFSNIPELNILEGPENSISNNWLNILKINYNSKYKRTELLKKLNSNNINARPVWIPNHLQNPYKKCKKFKVSYSNRFYQSSICLPSSPDLTTKDIVRIFNTIK